MNVAEKNKRIAELVYPTCDIHMREDGTAWFEREPRTYTPLFDYRNWNDLMPLVDKYGINNYWDLQDKEWCAYWDAGLNHPKPNYSIEVNNTNLQHALADCLLRVLEEKSDENS